MRLYPVAIALLALLYSCASNTTPDVSHIKVPITTERFEQAFFDTTSANLASYLKAVNSHEGAFTADFLSQILVVDPHWPMDTTAAYVNGFIKAYQPIYKDAQKIFKDFSPYEKEIVKGLQFVKYYFPTYKLPQKIITYIGPADGYGDILSNDALIVGLQHHLGKDNSLYKTNIVQETYPAYLSCRFEPSYIAINSMKNIVLDLYPETQDDKPLVDQMIEKGKRLYVLSRLLPEAPEYQLIGYTKAQLEDCYGHEAVIWDLFIKQSLLQMTDKNTIKNYIGEGPKTQELGEGSPGNIGSFAGWQIVKKYLQKNPETTLQKLMAMDNEQLLQGAKYKP